jgi:hypothetical protein
MKDIKNFINESSKYIRIFYVSVDPNKYDIKKISKMDYDDAKEFFKDYDEDKCHEMGLAPGYPGQFFTYNADKGDDTYVMFVWYH